MSTLVLVDVEAGAVTELTRQVLTLAHRTGDAVDAVVLDPSGLPGGHDLGAFGVGRVHVASGGGLEPYAPAAWAQTLAGVIRSGGYDTVLGTSSDRAGELLAHAAVALSAPLCALAIELRPGTPYGVTRQRWGGSVVEDATLSGDVRLITIAPHLVEPAPAGQAAAAQEVPAEVVASEGPTARLVRHEPPVQGEVALGEAKLVVGGGRGVGGTEGFGALEELAGLLGGVVGGSRVVTNNGWQPHERQIGQTGARIAPDLYIACGVSGAVQHMVGCKGARRILAINKDREAPIIARADYAVIGDLNEVVPAVIAELKKAST